jgi:hypothetical protein
VPTYLWFVRSKTYYLEEEIGEAVWVSRPKESIGPTRNVKSFLKI